MPPPKDWNDLNSMLWQRSIDSNTGKFKPYIAFRGLSEEYDLKTSIQRLKDRRSPNSLEPIELAWRERRMIDTFRMYAQEHLSRNASDWEVLLLAQHHRLPTRLLDWTLSPFVALFFATENTAKWDKDGIIWCVSRLETTKLLPVELQVILKNNKSTLFSLEILQNHFPSLVQFDDVPKPTLIWFEPPSINPRIINQYALFSVMTGVETSQTEYFENNPGLAWGVPIPKELKPEIHDRLQVINITQRTIYPGHEGISLWLKAFYGT